MSETIILSATMQAFIASGVPEFGSERPFTLSHDDVDFEAVTWWNLDEYSTVGVVLPDSRNLFYAIMAMHNHITTQWDMAAKNLRNGTPESPSHEFEDGYVLSEYYNIDSLLGFGYRMALIIPPSIGKEFMRYTRPYDLEMYMVLDDKTVYARLPNSAREYQQAEDELAEGDGE